MDDFFEYLYAKALKKGTDAAGSGELNDGGKGALMREIAIYKAGMKDTFPNEWYKYRDEYEKMIDPEYQEYKRLKNKFEGEGVVK